MTLRSSISTPEAKRRYVRRLFATIADRYDFITRVLSYGQDQRWKARLIARASIGRADRVLDLACGTGDLSFAAARTTDHVVGLDVTHRMLQLAMSRRATLRVPASGDPSTSAHAVRYVCGDMVSLPFPDGSFDVVTTGYGLRNVPDLSAAVREIRRVLAPGGRFLSLDFNRPENAIVRAAYLTYLTAAGSALGFALHADPDTYRYIPESIRLYPGAAGVAAMLGEAGFTDVRTEPLLGGLMTIHVGKV